ncbi:hypothetical protein EYZ11_012289 [Aspergillus tanneri]|uniref:Uncharacterized protein n=1 Tax=Aspergillus tanneri TaxID=1220188 RepID=A0A4S3J2P8_9EURO|nr:hypothetical protein EYZ11_012289 [Aspergillus tanneri]
MYCRMLRLTDSHPSTPHRYLYIIAPSDLTIQRLADSHPSTPHRYLYIIAPSDLTIQRLADSHPSTPRRYPSLNFMHYIVVREGE